MAKTPKTVEVDVIPITDDALDKAPLDALLAAVARRKENPPYESEADLLAAEATGWVAVAILRDGSRFFASVFGPYGSRITAREAVLVIQRNHAIAKRKKQTRTVLVKAEAKPAWKEPT